VRILLVVMVDLLSLGDSMMRTILALGLTLAAATLAHAQARLTQAPSDRTPAPKSTGATLVLTGCVPAGDAAATWFTLSDKRARTTYRLAGTDVRVYVGRRVQVFGGLVPSANIAAQAGAIDSTKVAMAVIDRSLPGTGDVQLNVLRINRIRPLKGSCLPAG
jgi:hypothetical protein